MMRATILMLAALVAVAVVPLPTLAQTYEFKLLPRYSIATFKSDAPLETFVGHSSDVAGGIQGNLRVDPAGPQGGKATVRVDMTSCGPVSTSATPTCAASRTSLPQLGQVGPRDILVFLQASPLLWLAVT